MRNLKIALIIILCFVFSSTGFASTQVAQFSSKAPVQVCQPSDLNPLCDGDSGGSGTVTSIATTAPITGGTITTTGTIGIGTASPLIVSGGLLGVNTTGTWNGNAVTSTTVSTISGQVTNTSPITLSGSGTSVSPYNVGINTTGTWNGNAATATSATSATTASEVNGASVPASATLVGTNSSSQFVSQTGTIANNTSGTSTGISGSQTANYVLAAPNGSSGTAGFRALVGADLPNPSASTLGGIESLASVSHKWINTISTSGVPSATQPAPSDLSGEVDGDMIYGVSGAWTVQAPPTWNQNTTGSAATWTTARNLAGNSVNGSANVNFSNKFIAQGTSDSGLSGAQFLGSLGTGLVKNTTTTGVLSIGAGDTDYQNPISLTTTGSSGAATFSGDVLNIPQYSGGGGTNYWSLTAAAGNVGISTTNTVGIGTTSGNAALTIMNGNVGLGTWNPSNILDVVGGVGIGTSGADIYVTSTVPVGELVVEKNVGIGSITPGQQLDVQGTVRATNLTIIGNVGIGTASANAPLVVTGTGTLSLTTTGNVGVGTASAAYGLTIFGNVGIGTANAAILQGVTGSGTTSCLCKQYIQGICTSLGTCT